MGAAPNNRPTWARMVAIWLGLSLLAAACQPRPESPPALAQPSPLQVICRSESQPCDNFNTGCHTIIENRSPDPIEIVGLDDFSLYLRQEEWRWVHLYGTYFEEPRVLLPGETLEVNMGAVLSFVCGYTHVMSVPYRVLTTTTDISDRLYKLYSPWFDVGDAGDAPEDEGQLRWHEFTFHLPASQVTIKDGRSSGSTWIVPACARSLVDWVATWDAPGFYPHATLERLTDWGTWEVILPDYDRCTEELDLIEIPSQSRRMVDLWAGVDFNVDQLDPGWYRWNVVYYHRKPEQERSWPQPYYRFSEVFQVQE